MKHKIKLFSSHIDDNHVMPVWWRNFIYHLHLHREDDEEAKKVNEALKPYNARFRTTIKRSPYGIRYVTFDSEEDYVLFILRWS
jgi:hypothetical protein